MDAAELGWLGLGVDERFGGSGGSLEELAVVLTELGEVVAPGAIASASVLGVGAVLLGATEAQQHELLPDLAEPERSGSPPRSPVPTVGCAIAPVPY